MMLGGITRRCDTVREECVCVWNEECIRGAHVRQLRRDCVRYMGRWCMCV